MTKKHKESDEETENEKQKESQEPLQNFPKEEKILSIITKSLT